MKFTMPVDKVVATRVGHTIEFKRGVPTHVPKEAWREVQQAGAVPEEQETVVKTTSAAPVPKQYAPDDPVERREAMFAAFTAIIEANRRTDFSANGVPTEKAMEKTLGFEIDSKERDELWNEYRQLSAKNEADAAAAKQAEADARAKAKDEALEANKADAAAAKKAKK